jgi:hypothetical protein
MAANWHDCTLDVLGASSDRGGVTDLVLTSATFTGRGVRAETSVRKEILAVAIAALTSNRRVAAFIEDSGPTANTLYALQIRA